MDDPARTDTLTRCAAPDLYYVDPRTPEPITDLQALIRYIGQYTEFAPGASARVAAQSRTHLHTRATVAFEMPGSTAQLGQYMIDTDGQNRVTRLIGFAGTGEPS